MARSRRSLSLPIVLSSVAVALSITLLVFWLLIVVREYELGPEVSANTWLIVLGSVAFAFIMVVLVLFAVFLVSETQEVRRQDRFIDSVTHELKSPLASIRLGLETLGRTGLDETRREGLRGMMLADVERLSFFIESVLEAGRLAHERGGHDLRDEALLPMVQEVARRVAHRHRLEPEAVRIEIPPDLVLRTERVALETILGNVIDNAIKYSDPPPEIHVLATPKSQERIEVCIQDRGIGIDSSELPRVVQRFHRGAGEEVRRRRGTGLGLYVVAALVQELGGKLRLHSDGPGLGTEVRIVLPGRRPAPAPDEETA
jgi:signal transduction histidine kinase